MQAKTFEELDLPLSYDAAIDEHRPERLSMGKAFWVIAGLSATLWAGIVSLVSALS
ncbi:hypothetical protein [Muricoccus vinaceus]|uniref:YmiA family membrane protein n=1 Tax=Muricoccus vinaceus TaxID=424704 RepID=A0ABV6J138_9PROT